MRIIFLLFVGVDNVDGQRFIGLDRKGNNNRYYLFSVFYSLYFVLKNCYF